MAAAVCPQVPGNTRFQVKKSYRAEIANRFGSVYTSSELRRRRPDDSLFAPVSTSPGGIAVFTWPPIRLEESWLEPI